MKRVVLASLCVALLAGVANAQYGTADLWLSSDTGTGVVDVLVSETAVIQVWMDYNPATAATDRMVGGDIFIEHRVTEGHDFEVVGFSSVGTWGGLTHPYYLKNRGDLDDSPFDDAADYVAAGNLSDYIFTGNVSASGIMPDMGLGDTGTGILVDEIIIHGINTTVAPNLVSFSGSAGSGTAESSWFEFGLYNGLGSYPALPSEMAYNYVNGKPGKSAKALLVNVSVPEPGSLALLAFGGLAAIRRRR